MGWARSPDVPPSATLAPPMFLTISTTHRPATDLGYLLHKNPSRLQLSYIGEGSSPSPPSLTAPGGGQIDIFAQGFDGNLYQSLGIPPPSWTGPFNLGYAPV